MRAIFHIEQFIILLIVATSFGFCFWQEWDEKRRWKKDIQKYVLDKRTSVMFN